MFSVKNKMKDFFFDKNKMKKKSLVNVNHKRHHNAFLFQALFSAIVLGLAFLIDGVLEEIVDHEYHGSNKKYIKMAIQFVVVFLLTIIVIYIFYWTFGWGDTFLG